jgi:hypothetical protein
LERARLMRNLRTSKYKKPKYFVHKNGIWWEVVEFPTNDIVRSFSRKIDAEMFSEQLTKNPPFGERGIPKFLKGNPLQVDISE